MSTGDSVMNHIRTVDLVVSTDKEIVPNDIKITVGIMTSQIFKYSEVLSPSSWTPLRRTNLESSAGSRPNADGPNMPN